jgi:ssDNA-binding Zn-finger/Zn-ribbon topoisomerase 1
MKALIKCFKCNYEWYEDSEEVKNCPKCHEWQVAYKTREKMTL